MSNEQAETISISLLTIWLLIAVLYWYVRPAAKLAWQYVRFKPLFFAALFVTLLALMAYLVSIPMPVSTNSSLFVSVPTSTEHTDMIMVQIEPSPTPRS